MDIRSMTLSQLAIPLVDATVPMVFKSNILSRGYGAMQSLRYYLSQSSRSLINTQRLDAFALPLHTNLLNYS